MSRNAWICIIRYDLFEYAIKNGIYGTVEADDKNRDFSSLSGALCVRPGDFVFFYRRKNGAGRKLYGVFEASSNAFYDDSSVWSGARFPYRFLVKPHRDYGYLSEGLEHLDLLTYIDEGKLWTMRSPAMERRGTKKSMHKITLEEASFLIEELKKINDAGIAQFDVPNQYEPPSTGSLKERLDRTLIEETPEGKVPVENVLEAWMMHSFLERDREVVRIFGDYSEFLAEVPIFVCEPSNQVDLLLVYDNGYKIIELKKDELRRKVQWREERAGTLNKRYREEELPKMEKYKRMIENRRGTKNVQCVLLGKKIDQPLRGYLPSYLNIVEYDVEACGNLRLYEI